jgi:hypothetical protein
MSASTFNRAEFAARAQIMGRAAWSFTVTAAKFLALVLLLAAALGVAASGWLHALWSDAAVRWDALHDAARSGDPPWSLTGQRNFYLCMVGGGLLVAFLCDNGLKNWWALHVTGKAPALLVARIEKLEAENGGLHEELACAYQDLKEVEEYHDTAGFERLASVLKFPGIRAVVLAALHPDRARNDEDRKTMTERFQLASAVFDDLAEG